MNAEAGGRSLSPRWKEEGGRLDDDMMTGWIIGS